MPILAVSYFARNIYEIETVISGLHYIEVQSLQSYLS